MNSAPTELETLVRARYPILYIDSYEEDRVEQAVADVACRRGKNLVCWSVTRGLHTYGESLTKSKRAFSASTTDPVTALDEVIRQVDPTIFLFKDLHPFLKDHSVVRKLRELAHHLKSSPKTLVLLSPELQIPTEVEKDITPISFPLPNLNEMANLLDEIITDINEHGQMNLEVSGEDREMLQKAALGLTLKEAENAFARAVVQRGKLTSHELPLILNEKKRVIQKSGILEYYEAAEKLEDVGGLLNWLKEALDIGASDLHLVVGLPPSVRVDGEIEFLAHEPLEATALRKSLITLLSDSQKEKLEQRRDLEFSYSNPELGRVRVSFYYAYDRLEACFRIVPKEIPGFEQLGLPPVVRELAGKTSGLILVTGATGQGKTTTMNAIIDHINRERRARIITIEDPIEYVHTNKRSVVIQREVPTDASCFPSALTSALRQDPNVICVGELRNLDTMATALTAAETGHLVLATLHTNSSTGAIDRMIDAFPAHQQNQVRIQIAGSLRGVVCLQLLPRLAQKGRVLACEILVANQGVRTLIRGGRSDQLRNSITMGQAEGMIAMDQSLRTLYECGEIAYEQAVQCSFSGDLLRPRSSSAA